MCYDGNCVSSFSAFCLLQIVVVGNYFDLQWIVDNMLSLSQQVKKKMDGETVSNPLAKVKLLIIINE